MSQGPGIQVSKGLVSDAMSSAYIDGAIKPMSMTNDGRLRVATINESYNLSAWGDPEQFGTGVRQGTFTAW